MTYYYIQEVANDYHNGKYENKLPSTYKLRKYKEDHVFDEDKSVKWNRDQVKIENELVQKQKNEYKEESNKLHQQLVDDIIEALTNEYSFNENQARIIYGYAYREYHSNGYYDILTNLEEICDVFKEVLEAGGE